MNPNNSNLKKCPGTPQDQNKENAPRDKVSDLVDTLKNAVKSLQVASSMITDFFHSVRSWEPETIKKHITYEEIVEFFVNHQPKDFKHGLMSRERREFKKDYIFTQAYLDANGELVTDTKGQIVGRRLIVQSFDSELEEVFGDEQVVIVE